jgi:dimethylhistidine N-methyltransferase
MPRFAASSRVDASQAALAEDVAYYLRQTPRQLPSRYLYDALGSSLFEAICRLPWYEITRTEQRLLTRHAREILRLLPPLSNIVELGPGSGEKLVTLLASSTRPDITVHLVDISGAALAKAAAAVSGCSAHTIVTHETTYEDGLQSICARCAPGQRTLALFLGSNLGNFDPPGAEALLLSIRAAIGTGSALLVGLDLVKPEGDLLLAYDDPLGVTAAFNRNLLVRVNRELGADFDVNRFAHRAVWNESASRVEMHLVSDRGQRVRVPAADLELWFEPGEAIWTESSYKYEAPDIAAMLGRAGFSMIGQWIENRYAVTLMRATEDARRSS